MKRNVAAILGVALALALLSACSSQPGYAEAVASCTAVMDVVYPGGLADPDMTGEVMDSVKICEQYEALTGTPEFIKHFNDSEWVATFTEAMSGS